MSDLIRSACLTSYPELARSFGLAPARMLDSVGIDVRCLEDPDIKLPAGSIGRLLEVSARAAGIEDFGLRLAETRTLAILGPVGLLVREEATVRDALRSLIRYIRLHNEALHLRLLEEDGKAVVSAEIRVGRLASVRQGIELTVGVLYRILSSLLDARWRPFVRFAHDAPRRRATHRRLFGDRVTFGQDFNGIVCASRDLDRPIPASDPTLARYARLHLDAMLDRPDASISGKVKELIYLQLGSGKCTADRVAGQLNIDRRTLHRKLVAEKTTFTAIVDQVRDEIVTRTLPRRDSSLRALADVLGFSSLSAFSRWFRGRYRTSATASRAAHKHAISRVV